MDVKITDIKKATIITFNEQRNEANGFSVFCVSPVTKSVRGILEDDFFLDVDEHKYYPLVPLNENERLTEEPHFYFPYAACIDSYVPLDEFDQEEVIKKANDWQKIREPENIVSFEKRKIRKTLQKKDYF